MRSLLRVTILIISVTAQGRTCFLIRHSGARAQHTSPESRIAELGYAALDSGPGAFLRHPGMTELIGDDSLRRRLFASVPYEHPVVLPHVSHFMQVPFLTTVKFWHSPQASPS